MIDPSERYAVEREREHGRWIAWLVVSGRMKATDEAFRIALRICAGLPDYSENTGGRTRRAAGSGRKKGTKNPSCRWRRVGRAPEPSTKDAPAGV